MDPHDGEISRAMRNRSVEIFVDKLWYKTESDIATLADLSGQVIPKQVISDIELCYMQCRFWKPYQCILWISSFNFVYYFEK